MVVAAIERLPEFLVLGAVFFRLIDKHRVVTPLNFLKAVAHGLQKILVGCDDRSITVELDDCLGSMDGVDLPLVIHGAALLLADVGCELYDSVGPAARIHNRIVGRLDPDSVTVLAQAPELAAQILSSPESVPGRLVFRTLLDRVIDKHRVMPPLNFLKAIAHGLQKIRVRRQNRSIQIELDDGLGTVDGFDLPLICGIPVLLFRDIRRKLDDLVGLALGIHDRIVGRADPYFAPVLAKPAVYRRLEIPALKHSPKVLVLITLFVRVIDEHRMILAENLVQLVAHGLQKIRVRRQDSPFQVEFDHSLGTVDCL